MLHMPADPDDLNGYLSVCTLTRLLRAGRHPGELFNVHCGDDANVTMRMAQLMHIFGREEMACEVQATALTLRQRYSLRPQRLPCGLRLLVILAPGFALANTPVEHLLEYSDVAVELLYVTDSAPLPDRLPDHDVVLVAIGQFARHARYISRIATLLQQTASSVVNRPSMPFGCERDRVSGLLRGVDGLFVPNTRAIDRAALLALTENARALDYPVIVRPLLSQAGFGLTRCIDAHALQNYVARSSETAFYISPFVDYAGPDGLYRKCRVVLMRGHPYVCHLAISDQWMVHYKTAGMDVSLSKRVEEASFMRDSAAGFCRRHAAAFRQIAQRLQLDYIVVDCAELQDGQLLFFEADNVGIVHAMDTAPPFEYKETQMAIVFKAFRELLAQSSLRQGPGTDPPGSSVDSSGP